MPDTHEQNKEDLTSILKPKILDKMSDNGKIGFIVSGSGMCYFGKDDQRRSPIR